MPGNYTATNAQGVTYALVYTPASTLPPVAAHYTLTVTEPGGAQSTVSNISPNNVLLSSGGTLTTASVTGTSVYVVPPGITGTVNLVANLLGTSAVYVAGSAVITGGASVGANTILTVDGGSASLGSGLVAGALSGAAVTLENGGSFGNGVGLLTALNGASIGFGSGGGLFDISAGGALVDLSGTSITGFNVATDRIEFDNLKEAVDHYTVTTSGASQSIALFGADNARLATVVVAGTGLATGTVRQGQSGPLTVSATGGSVVIDPATAVLVCFLAGTRIATPAGERAIETLAVGDPVLTADGRAVPVRWLGLTRVDTRFADPARVMPIRVRAGALAEGVPARDLLVSPDHALFLDGVLIPARLLNNGDTIAPCPRGGVLAYYHLEVEPHELVVAEGAATESYLDTGNRRHFTQPGAVAALRPGEPKSWEDACAPLVLAGPRLDAVRTRLAGRARAPAGETADAAAAPARAA